MLLSPNGGEGPGRIADRIAGFGGLIEAEADLFAAIEAMQSDAIGYGLFIMECDAYGGLEVGRRALAMMGRSAEHTKVILISREVVVQTFPEGPSLPILLRSPISAVSLRVGFEHALRDRLVYQAA
ncbi:MAG: hypothetical protein ACK4GO_11490 [Gemmobacter sp.]